MKAWKHVRFHQSLTCFRISPGLAGPASLYPFCLVVSRSLLLEGTSSSVNWTYDMLHIMWSISLFRVSLEFHSNSRFHPVQLIACFHSRKHGWIIHGQMIDRNYHNLLKFTAITPLANIVELKRHHVIKVLKNWKLVINPIQTSLLNVLESFSSH